MNTIIRTIIFLPFLILLLLFITPKYSSKHIQSGGGYNKKLTMNYKYFLLLLGIIGFSNLVYNEYM